MSKEQYVTFEVARLLKDKGFDWDIRQYYALDSKTNVWDLEYDDSKGNYNIYGENLISAPTQQMAMRWLREEKGVHIYPIPITGFNYMVAVYVEQGNGTESRTVLENTCNAYEDAVEAALQYVLTNLI